MKKGWQNKALAGAACLVAAKLTFLLGYHLCLLLTADYGGALLAGIIPAGLLLNIARRWLIPDYRLGRGPDKTKC